MALRAFRLRGDPGLDRRLAAGLELRALKGRRVGIETDALPRLAHGWSDRCIRKRALQEPFGEFFRTNAVPRGVAERVAVGTEEFVGRSGYVFRGGQAVGVGAVVVEEVRTRPFASGDAGLAEMGGLEFERGHHGFGHGRGDSRAERVDLEAVAPDVGRLLLLSGV